jgi:predicted metal-dependent phosphoesterase TrpH
MPNRTVDLHVHTTWSDGTDSPARVVELAHREGLAAIAITDHDNTEALALAQPAAARLGLELIPGIEMSASADGREVHVLGYGFDAAHPALVQHLATQQARRVVRVHEMVKRLDRVGVHISAEDVLRLAGDGTVGRPHVARALVERGYVASLSEAFDRYLGSKGPGFVPGSPLAPAEVIRVIREASGVPVLAHPVYLECDALIETFVRDGLAGLEVYHSRHTPELVRRYEELAERLQLVKTGGSDYHGEATDEGARLGSVRLPYALVEALREWQAAARR